MTCLFRVEIPGRVAIKKNSLQRVYSFRKKRTVTISGDRYLKWAEHATVHVKQAWLKWNRETITEPVYAKYIFCFENHASEPDTSNCIEGPQDVLAKVGVIANDKQVVALSASKEFGVSAKTIVELYSAKDAE